jgi:hypothetical protein
VVARPERRAVNRVKNVPHYAPHYISSLWLAIRRKLPVGDVTRDSPVGVIAGYLCGGEGR